MSKSERKRRKKQQLEAKALARRQGGTLGDPVDKTGPQGGRLKDPAGRLSTDAPQNGREMTAAGGVTVGRRASSVPELNVEGTGCKRSPMIRHATVGSLQVEVATHSMASSDNTTAKMPRNFPTKRTSGPTPPSQRSAKRTQPTGSTAADGAGGSGAKSYKAAAETGLNAGPFKVFVVPQDKPDSEMTTEDVEHVANAVGDRCVQMWKAERTCRRPHMTWNRLDDSGRYAVMCEEEWTVQWLKAMARTIPPRDGRSYIVLRPNEMPERPRVKFNIRGANRPAEQIRERMCAQNAEEFGVERWEVAFIRRNEKENYTTVAFKIPKDCFEHLKAAKFGVYYEMCQLTGKLLPGQAGRTDDQ